jgi:hypothetical protein
MRRNVALARQIKDVAPGHREKFRCPVRIDEGLREFPNSIYHCSPLCMKLLGNARFKRRRLRPQWVRSPEAGAAGVEETTEDCDASDAKKILLWAASSA